MDKLLAIILGILLCYFGILRDDGLKYESELVVLLRILLTFLGLFFMGLIYAF